jgi:hypothetical protein
LIVANQFGDIRSRGREVNITDIERMPQFWEIAEQACYGRTVGAKVGQTIAIRKILFEHKQNIAGQDSNSSVSSIQQSQSSVDQNDTQSKLQIELARPRVGKNSFPKSTHFAQLHGRKASRTGTIEIPPPQLSISSYLIPIHLFCPSEPLHKLS